MVESIVLEITIAETGISTGVDKSFYAIEVDSTAEKVQERSAAKTILGIHVRPGIDQSFNGRQACTTIYSYLQGRHVTLPLINRRAGSKELLYLFGSDSFILQSFEQLFCRSVHKQYLMEFFI